MEPAVPKKIDKYDVLGLIARGGMGVVYKAIDCSLDRLVAIKMVASADEEHRDHLQRFFREAQSTANLRHQNIVTVYGMGEFKGTPYLVMEYLSGKSLDSLIDADAMTLQQKLNCIGQVCHGLHYAHSRQPSIIHRDIKPGNIVVIEDGTAKIIDFGIARVGQSRHTRTGFVMGSYQYMSPEQISGTELDGRSDIFSTGIVLYQLLTRTLPFSGDNISETLQSVIHESPAPLSRFLGNYPAKLDEVVARALAKHREERYASAGDFAFDLLTIEQQLKRELHTNNLAQAEAFIANRQYEQAKQELLQIIELDGKEPRANELLRKIQRATAKQQRKTRADSLRVHAEEALQMNRLHDALGYLDQAIRLDSGNAELRTFRDRVSQVVAHADKIDDILARAQRAHAEGDLEGAQRAVQEGLLFDPASARVKSFQAILERGLANRGKERGALNPASARSIGSSQQVRDKAARMSGRDPGARKTAHEPDPIWSDAETDLPQAHFSTPVPPPSGDLSEAATAPLPMFQNVEPRADSSPDAQERAVSMQPAGDAAGPVADEPESPSQPAALPDSILRMAEKELASYIGALAKIVVRKVAARTTDRVEFYRLLAESIQASGDRDAFLSAIDAHEAEPEGAGNRTVLSALPVEQSQALPWDAALTTAAVEHAAQLLARYVGPLAGILTRKASQRADNLRSLYLLLAEHIGTETERTRFLQEAGLKDT
jgi:serine/threonine protein kinase